MSTRWLGWLSWFCFGAAVCFLGVAGYLYFAPAPAPALEVGQTDFEILDGVAGEKRDVVLRLHNRSSRPVPVLGMKSC